MATTPAPLRELSGERVIAEALSLLDDVGEARFTMRALAERLGTYPNTVYWHVGNRELVLALAVERALSEVAVPEQDRADWTEWLAALAHEYRRVLHRHPAVAPVAASQLLVSPASLDLVEHVLGVLNHAGFSGQALVGAYNAFIGSLVGWVSLELASPRTDDHAWKETFAAGLDELDAERHPTLAAHKGLLADEAFALRWHGGQDHPLDTSFEVVLRVWLGGLRSALAG